MEREFTVLPRRSASAELQDTVRAILRREAVLDQLPSTPTTFVWIEDPVPEGSTLVEAHGNWTATSFGGVETPGRLPRQHSTARCPAGILHVEVECIERRTGGMGSYYQFKGYFASLLVLVDQQEIWDARGEIAK